MTTSLQNPIRQPQGLVRLYEVIREDLAQAEAVFARELGSRSRFVQDLVDHAVAFGGKRLRPALVLLSARACGGIRPAHATLAAVVEMIHTATLVHDDILDEADVRRHLETVNSRWGSQTAVLLGDYLFTHAFHLAASLESTRACRWIGHATNLVCEGEMIQIHHQGNLDLTEDQYMEIIAGKTAELVAVSCKLGAHYAGADRSTELALEGYGRKIGIAFQIADDVLDIWGEEQQTGKSLGTDVAQQKLTLPLIWLLRNGPGPAVQSVRAVLAAAPTSESTREHLRSVLEESGALDYAWQVAGDLIRSAVDDLAILDSSADRDRLRELAHLVIRRSN